MADRHYARDVVHRNWNWGPCDNSYRVINTACLLHIARCMERMTQRLDAIYHETQAAKAKAPVKRKRKPAVKAKVSARKK